jgi:polar amino acid transport system permease protein
VTPSTGAQQEATQPGPPQEIEAVPVRHPGRWIGAAIVALIAASLIRSAIENPNFHWDVVGDYLFDHRILDGVVKTIELTVLGMVIGIVLGVLLAVMRLSPNFLIRGASWFYIWAFRGTPLIVQILFWNFIAALYPTIDLGIPFGPSFIHLNANDFITLFLAGTLALGLNEGAYMAEIVRAGIISVEEGQTEASKALGLTRAQTLRHIVLPQAMRVIIPPTGNETISMLKNSSLVSVIALAELLYSAQLIYSQNFQQIPLLIVASIWYLAMTSVLSIGQFFLERHYGRGRSRDEPTSLFDQIRSGWSARHADPDTLLQRHGDQSGGGAV